MNESRYTRACEALRTDGQACRAKALRDSDPPRCRLHSLSPEERTEAARKAAEASVSARREAAGLRTTGRNRPYVPGPTLERTLEVIAELLEARVPGSDEPDVLARSWGVLAVATLFRLTRDDRAELIEKLAAIRPQLARSPYADRLLDLDAARAELIRLYELGAIDADELPPGVLGFRRATGRVGLDDTIGKTID